MLPNFFSYFIYLNREVNYLTPLDSPQILPGLRCFYSKNFVFQCCLISCLKKRYQRKLGESWRDSNWFRLNPFKSHFVNPFLFFHRVKRNFSARNNLIFSQILAVKANKNKREKEKSRYIREWLRKNYIAVISEGTIHWTVRMNY